MDFGSSVQASALATAYGPGSPPAALQSQYPQGQSIRNLPFSNLPGGAVGETAPSTRTPVLYREGLTAASMGEHSMQTSLAARAKSSSASATNASNKKKRDMVGPDAGIGAMILCVCSGAGATLLLVLSKLSRHAPAAANRAAPVHLAR